MSEKKPPPQPTIIGSGKTYKMKPDDPAPVKKPVIKPDASKKNSDLTARLMATLRRSDDASKARQAAEPAPAPEPAPEETPTELSVAVKKRISNLQERNESVRKAIDSLPVPKTRGR